MDSKFSAMEHGFRFANSFDVGASLRVALLRKKYSENNTNGIPYGLCGGMCFAALDYYHANKKVPSFARVEDISPVLFDYLFARQLDTLKYGILAKVVIWTARRDDSLARSVAAFEVKKLRDRIDKREPAALVLIRAPKLEKLKNNHQVLATGYDYNAQTKDLVIRLYDPNYPYDPEHPQDSMTLQLNLAAPGAGLHMTHPRYGAVRAFFVLDYAARKPPEIA